MIYRISRIYILKRVFARLIVYLNNVRFIHHILKTVNEHLGDVEGIFHIFKVEREIENIIYINDVIIPLGVTCYLDIGGNYGQFSGEIRLDNRCKHIFEPNIKLIKYIENYSPGSHVYTKAVVPRKGDYTYVQDSNNSGANHVVPAVGNTELIDAIDVESLIVDLSLRKEKVVFIKIDVEGIEPALIESFHYHLEKERNAIFAFECLNKENYRKVRSVLNNYTLKEVRFRYQGISDRNWGSMWDVVKVLIRGKDELITRDITHKTDRNFYSLIYCFPNE